MQVCQHHWDMLREAIAERGMADLVASSGQEVALRMASDGFDPLVVSHNLILKNLADRAGAGILMIDGCPLCEANEAHAEGCQDPDCRPNWYDAWIDNAADDALTEAKRRGLIESPR